MHLYVDGGGIEPPAFVVPVSDTVGAGDACLGGFLASLLLRPRQGWPQHLRSLPHGGRGMHAPGRRRPHARKSRRCWQPRSSERRVVAQVRADARRPLSPRRPCIDRHIDRRCVAQSSWRLGALPKASLESAASQANTA